MGQCTTQVTPDPHRRIRSAERPRCGAPGKCAGETGCFARLEGTIEGKTSQAAKAHQNSLHAPAGRKSVIWACGARWGHCDSAKIGGGLFLSSDCPHSAPAPSLSFSHLPSLPLFPPLRARFCSVSRSLLSRLFPRRRSHVARPKSKDGADNRTCEGRTRAAARMPAPPGCKGAERTAPCEIRVKKNAKSGEKYMLEGGNRTF